MNRNRLFRMFLLGLGVFLLYHFTATFLSCSCPSHPDDNPHRNQPRVNLDISLRQLQRLLRKLRKETASNSERRRDLTAGLQTLDALSRDHRKGRENPMTCVTGRVADDVTFETSPNDAPSAVCPERYKGSTFGYPFFDKGFEIEPCIGVPKLKDIITLLFNFAHISTHGYKVDVQAFITQVSVAYPEVPMIIAVSKNDKKATALARYSNIEQINVDEKTIAPGNVWNTLIKKTRTKYAFFGRALTHFDGDARLERLIRELGSLSVDLIGGATRTPDGHWSLSCEQIVHRNFTLVYRTGYRHSKHGCLLCDHLSGPFIARTETLRDSGLTFHGQVKDPHIVFDNFFLNLKRHKKRSVVCPDAMFHVDAQRSRSDRLQWLPLAREWGINEVVLEDGKSMVFSCADIGRACGLAALRKGWVVPPCCLDELAKMVRKLLELCETRNIYCELQEGTLLGAVKFGKVLPWERDADITFWSANFSAMWDLREELGRAGYKLSLNAQPWCCAENMTAGGVFVLRGGHGWHVEIYGQHRMNTERLLAEGRPPTRLWYDGQWVRVPRNPGLYVRNRYGMEVYQHAQHWISMNKGSGWDAYDTSGFTVCPKPGSHDCLDQYKVDGNLQFGRPCL